MNTEKGKQITKPTDAELEIMQVLWHFGPSTVRFVNEELSRSKDVGYTTTLKILQIMNEKGLVGRERTGRTHIYSPVLDEEETQSKLLDRFLDTAFGGSSKKLVIRLLGQNKSSREEIEEIKKLINKYESEQS